MFSTEPSNSITPVMLSMQSGSNQIDRGQGNGHLMPSQVTMSDFSSAQNQHQFSILLSTLSSTPWHQAERSSPLQRVS